MTLADSIEYALTEVRSVPTVSAFSLLCEDWLHVFTAQHRSASTNPIPMGASRTNTTPHSITVKRTRTPPTASGTVPVDFARACLACVPFKCQGRHLLKNAYTKGRVFYIGAHSLARSPGAAILTPALTYTPRSRETVVR